MGQIIAKLNEKLLIGHDDSNQQESKGMLNDLTTDDNEIMHQQNDQCGDMLGTPKTPPNIVKLRCDPRSPIQEFKRTPLKVALEEE